MCNGSDSEVVASATIDKGAKRAAAWKLSKKEPIRKKKEYSSDSSDDGIRYYDEWVATERGYYTAEKEQTAEDEEWYVLKE